MVERTRGVLQQLRQLVEGAKSVPMSASCMVNRTEALSLIDQATQALDSDVGEAQRVTATSLETLERAQAEAAQIIASAEERAQFLAGQTPVMEIARKSGIGARHGTKRRATADPATASRSTKIVKTSSMALPSTRQVQSRGCARTSSRAASREPGATWTS